MNKFTIKYNDDKEPTTHSIDTATDKVYALLKAMCVDSIWFFPRTNTTLNTEYLGYTCNIEKAFAEYNTCYAISKIVDKIKFCIITIS